jgi:hypothetical protein
MEPEYACVRALVIDRINYFNARVETRCYGDIQIALVFIQTAGDRESVDVDPLGNVTIVHANECLTVRRRDPHGSVATRPNPVGPIFRTQLSL